MTVDEFVSKYKAPEKQFMGSSLRPDVANDFLVKGLLTALDAYLTQEGVEFYLIRIEEKYGSVDMQYYLPHGEDEVVEAIAYGFDASYYF